MASIALREKVVTTKKIAFRSSTKAFLLKSGTGWFAIALTVLTMGMAALFVAPLLLFKWISNTTSHYWLEGDRLFMRRGILIRKEEEIELYRIKDVKVTFSVIQQMFDNGDIAVISSDLTDNFKLPNVNNAREIREEIRNRVETARSKRGVREFDVG